MRELYLPANHLGDAGAAVLAAAADSARPVRLGLGGNGIGPAGAYALADALGGIEALDLGRPPSERGLGLRATRPVTPLPTRWPPPCPAARCAASNWRTRG